MNIEKFPYKNIIEIKKNKEISTIYDVELKNIKELKKFSSIDCHIILYPYSRKISSENFIFSPFEEYVKDIITTQKSAYFNTCNEFNKFFGLFIGFFIAIIFYVLNKSDLLSVQSIISVIGAYLIGKELWVDIERFFISLTKRWKIRYQDNLYQYKIARKTTLTFYSYLAKKYRYGRDTILPEKFDFIQQSNSQTLKMHFNKIDLERTIESNAHLLSIHIDKGLLKEFIKKGYMLGAKISFNSRFMGITRSIEFFQSISKNIKGCLDKKGNWMEDSVYFRITYSIRRIKFFLRSIVINNRSIIK